MPPSLGRNTSSDENSSLKTRDSFFNSFAIAKWRRYTRLDNLQLQIELKGRFHVQVLNAYYMNTAPFTAPA